MGRNQALGKYGEDLACRHLQDDGMVILERNWRCRSGELDIVAAHGDVLVVCEVKTRSSTSHGAPGEALTSRKVSRLRKLAWLWLESARRRGVTATFRDIRLDAVTVQRPPRGAAVVGHLQGVE